jgi:predicted RNA binding protein YcfA (HicA-like mRNA interferase family)
MKAFEHLGFVVVRTGNHIAMSRTEPDGKKTPLTLPNHRNIKSSTLRMALTQTGVSRDDFLTAYEDA